MVILRKRKIKRGFVYVVDYWSGSKRIVRSTGTSDRRLAEKVRANIENKLVHSNYKMEEQEQKDISLSEFLKIYSDAVRGMKLESTLAVEKIRIATFKEIVGDVNLRSITNETVERWRSKRLMKVKPATFNGERRVINTVLNKAVEYGYLQTNPIRKLKKAKEEQKRLYMTSDELRKFFAYLESMSKTARNQIHRTGYYRFKLFCEVLLNTGMRRSELLNLRLDYIDFGRNVILLEKTKGKKRREVPMTRRVQEIMNELSPSLFGDMTQDLVTHKFTDAAGEIGLQGMKLHSFRHTFGTMLIAMGYDITVVKELMGHEDITTTMIYAKADARLLRDAIKSLETLGDTGYVIVTRRNGEQQKLLEGKTTLTTGDSETTYSARNRT